MNWVWAALLQLDSSLHKHQIPEIAPTLFWWLGCDCLEGLSVGLLCCAVGRLQVCRSLVGEGSLPSGPFSARAALPGLWLCWRSLGTILKERPLGIVAHRSRKRLVNDSHCIIYGGISQTFYCEITSVLQKAATGCQNHSYYSS